MKLLHSLAFFSFLSLSWLHAAPYDNDSDETRSLLKITVKGDVTAMEQMGDIYSEGRGVQVDKNEAMNWYGFAAKRGSKTALKKLWKLETKSKKELKDMEYDEEATKQLCVYLYYAGGNSLMDEGALPKELLGKNATPSKTTPGTIPSPPYNAAIVRKLIKKGADPNAYIPAEDLPIKRTGTKINPFRFLLLKNDTKTAEFFITQGAVLHLGGNDLGTLAVNQMNNADEKKNQEKPMKFLLAHGYNLNAHSDWGSSLLMDCAIFGYTKGAKFLLERGADVNEAITSRYTLTEKSARDCVGETALSLAASNRQVDMVDLLLRHGADPNIIVRGQSLLDHIISSQGEPSSSSTTYEEELARLRRNSAKENPVIINKKKPDPMQQPRGNVAHLLKLAGAKHTKELQSAPAPAKD